ncbi:MAG TPA: NAD(+)/NADH kinase [Bryobacteraceae bacterium]|nr:NAD(+)/NADH kinase [Bryobacteraceae bacterium]
MPSPPVKAVGMIAKPRSDRAASLVPELIAFLESHEIAVFLDEEAAGYAGRSPGLTRDQVAAKSQLLVVLGGDGTLLSAARASLRSDGGRDLPLFAVNLGGLGFLTAIKIEEVYPQLERALHGDFRVASRRMLHVELWRGDRRIASHEALNDVVLTKAEIARMIDLEVHVDNHFVCVYKADGLIVATPTGSTAYSLSAGGPIMFPSVAATAITPICPHTLTNRPVIVPDESEIQVIVLYNSPTYMTIDGQVGEILETGDRIVCRRSEHCISLVRPPDMMFFDVLREKLKWGER